MDLHSVYEIIRYNKVLLTVVYSSTVVGLIWLIFVRTHTKLKDKWLTKPKTNDKSIDHLDGTYNMKKVPVSHLPRWVLTIFLQLTGSAFGKAFIVPLLMKISGLETFRRQILPDLPTLLPIVETDKPLAVNSEEKIDLWSLIKPGESTSPGFTFLTLSQLIELYRTHKVTPLQMAKTVVAAVKTMEESSHPMKIIIEYHEKDILKMAAESTQRYQAGKPLSVFDGVPISAKDNYKIFGCKTRTGTSYIECDTTYEEDESTLINQLRKGGAVIIGAANMNQLGIGVTGYNSSSKHGTSRNPYNLNYSTGGSCGGSAGSVASGICIVSLGVDGGGSIRIPSAACGVVGFKATFGRMSEANLIPMSDSVSHTGPMAPTVRDAAIAYGFLAGPDRKYPPSLRQPVVSLEGFEDIDLTGIKLGVDWVYFKDSDADIVRECQRAVEYLRTECNAEIVDIRIPELEEARVAHFISLMSEIMTYGYEMYHKHFDEMEELVKFTLLVANQISAVDSFSAQKQRTRMINILKSLFRKVDCIIFPAISILPPELNAVFFGTDFCNGDILSRLMRYMFLGNLTGIPSIVLPVGYRENNLPISIQICGAWWQEHMVLRVAHAAEGALKKRNKPELYFSIA